MLYAFASLAFLAASIQGPASQQEQLNQQRIPITEEAFLRYIKGGDTAAVARLLDAGMNPDTRDNDGTAAVVVAARSGMSGVAELLLKRGADPIPLVRDIAAPRRGSSTWLAELSQVSGVLIALVGLLFTYLYNQRSKRIHELETVEKMIPHLTADEDRKAAALVAVAHLATPALAIRLAELQPGVGSTLACLDILRAGKLRDENVIKRALRHVLVSVVDKGDDESFRLLKEQLSAKTWAELMAATNADGRTALMLAARNNHVDLIHALLESGAKIGSEDKDGETALHLATKHQHPKAVEALVSEVMKFPDDVTRRSFLRHTDKKGRTALDRARENRNAEIIGVLQKHDPADSEIQAAGGGGSATTS